MKKIIIPLIIIFAVSFSLSARAETVSYDFETEVQKTVTSSLGDGGTAVYTDDGFDGRGLELDGTYGVSLGDVTNTFSVSAMVKLTSTGSTDTIFFKNMGTSSSEKWTGVISAAGTAKVWTNDGSNFRWATVTADDEAVLQNWTMVTYTENAGTGTLYVNGEKVGSGSVVNASGTLCLGATYWPSDAPSGTIDNVVLCDSVLTDDEILTMYGEYAKKLVDIPSEAVTDIELPTTLGILTAAWTSSNEAVISSTGKVTRQDEDTKVTLTMTVDGTATEYEVTVLKKPQEVNDRVIFSYKFGAGDGEIIHDVSGNGNHAAGYGGISADENGIYLDGVDDYVALPDGIINGHDEITIVFETAPETAKANIFAYVFGNSSSEGYMFLNTSRPTTNAVRFAATATSYGSEAEIASVPGILKGKDSVIVITLDGTFASMYVDGELVMDGDLGMTVSDLGDTSENYIGKSLYSADGYFKGYVKEFTVYNYVMDDAEIAEKYRSYNPVYVDETESSEYITSVSFENGIDVVLDTKGRDDVYIAALAIDGEGNTVDFSIAQSSDELKGVDGDTVVVYAFDRQNNVPGKLYVNQSSESADIVYTPGGLTVTPKEDAEESYVIVAGYDKDGGLDGIAGMKTALKAGESIAMQGSFDNTVRFRIFKWESLVSMRPITD